MLVVISTLRNCCLAAGREAGRIRRSKKLAAEIIGGAMIESYCSACT